MLTSLRKSARHAKFWLGCSASLKLLQHLSFRVSFAEAPVKMLLRGLFHFHERHMRVFLFSRIATLCVTNLLINVSNINIP